MTTILITHRKGASLITPAPASPGTVPGPSTATTVQLPIPSRFPAKTTPRTAVAPSGHIYLWSDASEIIWEYDSKGRRIGEIVTRSASTKDAVGLGKVDGKETAVVDDGTALNVWDKDNKGKWSRKKVIERRPGHVQAISTAQAGLLAVLNEKSVTLHNLAEHSQQVVDLQTALSGEPARHIAVAGSPVTMVIASAHTAVVVINGSNGHQIQTLPARKPEETITGLAVSSKKGETRAALLFSDGALSLDNLGASSSSTAQSLVLANAVAVRFLDHYRLLYQAKDGSLSVQTLRATDSSPVKLDLPEATISIQLMPAPTASVKPPVTQPAPRSVSHASASGRTSVLGEARNAGNIAAPSLIDPGTKGRAGNEPTKTARIVSAPTAQPATQPQPSSSRSTSQPVVRRPPRPCSSLAAHHPVDPIAEEEDQAPEDLEDVHATKEQSLELDWALRPPRPASNDDASRGDESADMANLRREIGNMQLDMLRLGRTMKLEMRKAVQPLLKELAEQREMIGRQQQEIDRLRRGF